MFTFEIIAVSLFLAEHKMWLVFFIVPSVLPCNPAHAVCQNDTQPLALRRELIEQLQNDQRVRRDVSLGTRGAVVTARSGPLAVLIVDQVASPWAAFAAAMYLLSTSLNAICAGILSPLPASAPRTRAARREFQSRSTRTPRDARAHSAHMSKTYSTPQ